MKVNNCKHKVKSIIVVQAFAEWEETILQCSICKKEFSNTKKHE